jgi:hypothetical protein
MTRMNDLHVCFKNINALLEGKEKIEFCMNKSDNKLSIKDVTNGNSKANDIEDMKKRFIVNLFYTLENFREENNVTKNMVYLINNFGPHNMGSFVNTSHFVVDYKETDDNFNISLLPYTSDIENFDLLIATEQLS